jgi:hypothetical protein
MHTKKTPTASGELAAGMHTDVILAADEAVCNDPRHPGGQGAEHGGEANFYGPIPPEPMPVETEPSDFGDVPDQMKAARRWLLWRLEPNPDPKKKQRKVPYYVTGEKRTGIMDSPEDVARLGSFGEALAALGKGQYQGIGFALGKDGSGCWQGIDLDDLPSHPELGEIADTLPGYTEASPSGLGRHAVGYGRAFTPLGSNGSGVEAYSGRRFFTVTAESVGLGQIECLADFVEQTLCPLHARSKAGIRGGSSESDPAETIDERTAADLRDALNVLRSDDRELWVNVGLALKTLGDVGRGMWITWSQTSEKYDPAAADQAWESFKPIHTGYRAVFALAQEMGWINPLRAFGQAARQPFDGNGGLAPEPWAELVNPFVEHAAPQFPVDHLPQAMALYCREKSAQSAFDAGGYGFALLIAASNLIDHRARLNVGPLSVPAFLWGGLVAAAGGGKSPIMNATMKFAKSINDELVRVSEQQRAAFINTIAAMNKTEAALTQKPSWKQLIASDTTVEALGDLLKDNPNGMLLHFDELTEFVGRMDAYNGGSGKDRGAYLQAFDGGSKTINRKSSIMPLVVKNFSVGVLAGVQPEKLAELFKKPGGADGLFQRFLVYALPPAGSAAYNASIGTFTEVNCQQIFDHLHEWSAAGALKSVSVNPSILPLMERYHNQMRIVAQRTGASRLAEHLDKFPGFLARILFALHCIECAAAGQFRAVVTEETFNRALAIARVLYRHSEAVYEGLGQHSGGSSDLMRTACEAILSKNWSKFKRGDLTRDATNWKGADHRQADGAIDLLIELGWVREVTPQRAPGQPGRRSAGVFQVNPLVHERFAEQSRRIVQERAARYAAIHEIAQAHRAAAGQ